MRSKPLPFLGLLAIASAPLAAQRAAPTVASWTPNFAIAQQVHAPSLFPPAPDYRWEGLAIGGIGGGVFVAWGAAEFCSDSDSGSGQHDCFLATVTGFGIGAVMGGVVGGLIGGLFPKTPPDSTPTH